MNRLLNYLLLIAPLTIIGQTQEVYKFKEDIHNNLEKDTVVWKFQTAATEFSFSGHFKETLSTWDKSPYRSPSTTASDSSYFAKVIIIDAKEQVIEAAKKSRILIINEAHHLPQHRVFTTSLLKDLYQQGYRYLGLEALFSHNPKSRFIIKENGYYTQEPEFGNLIYKAIAIGFTLFEYEAAEGKNGKEREIEQAQNIKNFIDKNPDGKILIHCGYAHAYENEYQPWEKAMAGRLKDLTQIDPVTVDQTIFLERANPEHMHYFQRKNLQEKPIVLKDENQKIFNGFKEKNQTDIIVIHPISKLDENAIPHWKKLDRIAYNIPKKKQKNASLILAYRYIEFDHRGIPADILELDETSKNPSLYLSKGKYEIIIKNRDYKVIDRYFINI